MQSLRTLAADHRAQASGFIVFFLMIGLGALVLGLLDVGASQLFTETLAQTDKTQAEEVIKQRQTIWNNLLYMILIFAGVFLIARAVVQSRGP